jgi:hypothetical protein
MLVDGHQVISLPSRFRELPLEVFIKRLQVFQPPVLACPHFTEVTAQFHELSISIPGLSFSPRPRSSSILDNTNEARFELSFGGTRALPLIHKLVKEIKVTSSSAANEFRFDQSAGFRDTALAAGS